MLKYFFIAGVLGAALVAAQPESSPQAHAGGPIVKMPPTKIERMDRPEHPMDRWLAMSSQQREAQLARMQPERREKLIAQIENWQKMTPQQRERARWVFFLPPEKKRIVTEFNQWMQTLPDERRPVIRREINSLQELSLEARNAEVESPKFNRKFDAEERERIRKMVTVMPPD